jgi:hypothetical protein
MSDAQAWTLIFGTLTVQAAVLGVVLGAQTRWIEGRDWSAR